MSVWHLQLTYGSLLACEWLLVCDLRLVDELLMVCCLIVVVLNLFACFGFRGQFPWCVGALPAVGGARRAALSVVVVVVVNLSVDDTLELK